jgi:hypothetical protein
VCAEPLLQAIATEQVGTLCELWSTTHNMDKADFAYKFITEAFVTNKLISANLEFGGTLG